MEKGRIQPWIMEHVGRYAQIYAAAFSGEPWNDPWTVEDAEVRREFQSLEDWLFRWCNIYMIILSQYFVK